MARLRLISVFWLLSACLFCAHAQMKLVPEEVLKEVSAPRLSVDSASLDFDVRRIEAPVMNEDDAPASFVYRFRNAGKETVRILRLTTNCSCVSATCSATEVAPGDEAEISVRYSPKGHPGRFERRISVYTQDGSSPAAVLKLAVTVENGADPSGLWPVQMGCIRLRRSEVTFRSGGKAVETVSFVNLSGRPLALECERMMLPACLSFSTQPKVLEDGAEGSIVLEYDPSKGQERESMQVMLKGLGVPPSQSSIRIRMK